MGVTGGYSDEVGDYELYLKITRDEVLAETGHDVLFEVSAYGNGYSSENRVITMLLGRCGEIALNNNCKYFYTIDSDNSVTRNTQVNTNYSGNYAYTTLDTISKHTKKAVILISDKMIEGLEKQGPYNA